MLTSHRGRLNVFFSPPYTLSWWQMAPLLSPSLCDRMQLSLETQAASFSSRLLQGLLQPEVKNTHTQKNNKTKSHFLYFVMQFLNGGKVHGQQNPSRMLCRARERECVPVSSWDHLRGTMVFIFRLHRVSGETKQKESEKKKLVRLQMEILTAGEVAVKDSYFTSGCIFFIKLEQRKLAPLKNCSWKQKFRKYRLYSRSDGFFPTCRF